MRTDIVQETSSKIDDYFAPSKVYMQLKTNVCIY